MICRTVIPLVIAFSSAFAERPPEDALIDPLVSGGRYLEALSLCRELAQQVEAPDLQAEYWKWVADISLVFLDAAEPAREIYLKISRDYPTSSYADDALFSLGMMAYESGDLSASRQWFAHLLERYPASPRVHNARFVLDRMERGLQAEKPPPPSVVDRPVRVLLSSGTAHLKVGATAGFVVRDAAGSSAVYPPGILDLSASDNHLLLGDRALSSPIRLETRGQGHVLLGQRPYRGFLEIQTRSGKTEIINVLDLEEYLRGVVAGEMPSAWPEEALQAQAVASRTYVVYQIQHGRNPGYDLVATQYAQVYGGVESETARTDQAVAETAGEVLTYDGRPILAYFHANSGGHTADASAIWGSDLPYLQARPDPYSESAPTQVLHWRASFPLQKLGHKLHLPSPRTIRLVGRTNCGRVEFVELDGGRLLRLGSNRFRTSVDPTQIKSTFFQVQVSDGTAYFSGRGYGHGVGLSQWGAKGMARERFDYQSILQYYYSGTRIGHLRS